MSPRLKQARLEAGETFITKESGNSMDPCIKHRQPHRLAPCTLDEIQKGDIVYCRVKGKWYTHFVKGLDPQRGALIGNNRGGTNGWTKQIYGKVIEVLPFD